jgi:pilus assembly protein CpaB
MSTATIQRTNDGVRNTRPPKRVRSTAIALALILAIGATVAVFLYLNAVKKEHRAPAANLITVIVSKQDIPADTKLDSLISAGAFTTLQIPRDAVVTGAVTDLAQLRGRTTSTFVLQGEQITTARLQGSTQATGGVLGIPSGHVAVTVQLDPQKVPGEVLQPGDHVTVYGTYSGVNVISNPALQQILTGKTPPSPAPASGGTSTTDIGDFTVDLVPDVQVLRVSNENGSSTTSGSSNNGVFVTLALLPEDSQKVVFSQEKGSIWLALLPPGQHGTQEGLIGVTPILLQAIHGLAQ